MVVDHATADIAIFLMIGALRQAHKPLSGIREGNWKGKHTLGHDPRGKTLGILGMGGIGRVRHRSFFLPILMTFDKIHRKWPNAQRLSG